MMIKKMIFCLLGCTAARAMQSVGPITGSEIVLAKLRDAGNTENDVMRFLESFDDFNAHVDVNALLYAPEPSYASLIVADVIANCYAELPDKSSLLHKAVKRKFLAVVNFLLTHKADINILGDNWGFTPLGYAIVYNPDLAIIRTLLDHGADQHGAYQAMPNSAGLCALKLAVKHGRAEIIPLLLACGANPNETHGRHCFPPLMYTYYPYPESDKYRCAQLLLRAGADPAWRSDDGYFTILKTSAQNCLFCPDNTDICQAILQTRNKSRSQVLAERIRKNTSIPTMQLAIETTVSPSSRRAMISRLKHSRNFLLSLKTDDEFTKKKEITPLVYALDQKCLGHVIEIVKCLTYAEIKESIDIAKRLARYDILLQALAAPENYASVMHEARDDNNQKLIDDLKKVRTP